MRNTTSSPYRRPDASMSCFATSLLSPGFPSSTTHLRSNLSVGMANSLEISLPEFNFMEYVNPGRDCKDIGVEVNQTQKFTVPPLQRLHPCLYWAQVYRDGSITPPQHRKTGV